MMIWIPILAVLFLDETVATKELLGLIVVGVGTLIVQLRNPTILSRCSTKISLKNSNAI